MRRALFVPEVVQTSAMDCGPASLKSLLEGIGIHISYGRLREACQTDVDGTSIDTLEDVARQLGADAEQAIVPLDHLLLEQTDTLPALVIVTLPSGSTHFVVVWSAHGRFVQVMDPGMGRRWMTREQLLRELYVYTATVPATTWREHAASDTFAGPLLARLRGLGVGRGRAKDLVADALADDGWRSVAALDAATRLVTSLTAGGGVARGSEARRLLEDLYGRARKGAAGAESAIPSVYWSVRQANAGEDDTEENVLVEGAVVIHARGIRAKGADDDHEAPLSPELVAALDEPPSRPLQELWRALFASGILAPTQVAIGIGIAAAGTALEAILFRSLFDLGRNLNVADKRVWALVAFILFLMTFLLVEICLSSMVLRMGRNLEGRFRIAFLRKLPRLGDRYFQSRPISDMADRSHGVHVLRSLPDLGGQIIRSLFALAFTGVGIAWLDPPSAPLAAAVALISVAIPLLLQRSLTERDLRVRSHAGALSQYYLDALLGLVAIRTHGAEPALRREHESLLVDWVTASRARDRVGIATNALQSVLGLGLSGWLFLGYFARVGEPGGALLLLYWALSLPTYGEALALSLRQVPAHRNAALRLLEPLGAIEEHVDETPRAVATAGPIAARDGIRIAIEEVEVRAAGHVILQDANLVVEPGAHVAIVGPSGAGKSSLVGLLLGWHRASSGRVLIDGEVLDAKLDDVRRQTAWVDPAIQIWNRSMLDNLLYGAAPRAESLLGGVIDDAHLQRLLETLPEGLATPLGEGGGLVSGGEGQRVRFGRSALRPDARLVILDEPFRGLDRDRRTDMLARARKRWKNATLLCITHDVGDTLGFERVIVVEGGRLAEDGVPAELAARTDSRYARMLAAEVEVRRGLWGSPDWRRLRLEDGRVVEAAPPEVAS